MASVLRTNVRRFMKKLLIAIEDLKSPQIIIGGYASVILVGTLLLALPVASNDGRSVGFINALFTATASTCMTGLTLFKTVTQWTLFGKIVIIALVQIGGMGFMTVITMFLIVMGKKITLRERLIIQGSLNQNDLQGMVKLVKKAIIGTICVECLGALLLMFRLMLIGNRTVLSCLWQGLFLAISVFNNAGLDIMSGAGMTPFRADLLVNVVLMTLIILGGLGYTVWIDVIRVVRIGIANKNYRLRDYYNGLALHSKLVFEISLGLIICGAVFFFLAEYNNPGTIGGEKPGVKALAALFQSVTARTSGFYTIDQASMTLESKFMTIILMFIGGSPGGTAGGVKTITLGILFACIVSTARGKTDIEVHKRTISTFSLKKALVVFMLSFAVLVVTTMLLLISEQGTPFGGDFIAILFEAASAVSTTGLSMGLTPHLSVVGRLALVLCMFYGRVGPITIAIAIITGQMASEKGIRYPEGKIYVG